MREGMRKAGAKLLEPIMKVEVVTPEDYTGGIIGDLTSRRGMVQGQDTRGNAVFGPCAVLDAVRSLRSSAVQHLGRDPSEICLSPRAE